MVSEWGFVHPLINEQSINYVENKFNFTFPKEFVNCVKMNNAGYPPRDEYLIQVLLSFNLDDEQNIIKYNHISMDLNKNVIVFVLETFGNYFGFDRLNSNIVFLDSEEATAKKVANTFNEFLEYITK